MFSSHLVFCDINNHSQLPIKERVNILDKYWNICEKYRPNNLNEYSFYEIDNDSFMAGFSCQEGFYSGYDVLELVGSLTDDFYKNNISVSFGINLLACGHLIEWKIMPGLIEDLKMIHMPDEIFNNDGRIQRSRLAGDALIVTARLQSLAKKLSVLGCISVFQGGHINELNGYVLRNKKRINVEFINNYNFKKLGEEQYKWLIERNIKVFSMELK
jgi:hypothetical protein